MCLASLKLDLPRLRFITKSFSVQRREVKFGKECLLEIKPRGGEAQTSDCRMSELEGTSRISKFHHFFSFTDEENKSREGKRSIECHTAIQSWDQNLLHLIPVLGLSTYHIRGQGDIILHHSDRRGVESHWNYSLSSFHVVVLQWSCKFKNFINITLLRLLRNPKSQLLWVMGHALSIQ